MKMSSVASLKVIVTAITLAMLALAGAESTPKAKTHQIVIAYDKPENPAHERLRALLMEARVLEQVQEVLSPFLLPKLLPISFESCEGESEARYLYSEARIKVCYEYVDDIWKDAPTETTAAGVTPIDAIVGPLADVFFHEFGHALVDLHQIPILGREEYAADTISAMLMLSLGKDEARRLILGAAYWYTDDLETAVTLKPTELSSVHGTPHQRFFNLLCLAYGANHQMFGDLVEKGYLPEERAEDCKSEFQQAAHAFNLLISPHLDQSLASKVLRKRWMPDVSLQLPHLSEPDPGVSDQSAPSTH
jgi:hypothetical protein